MARREKKPHRKYTREFKLEAVKLVVDQKMKQVEVAIMARLGLEHTLNQDWMNEIF